MSTEFNTNVDDYSFGEMARIVNLDIHNITSSEIFQKTADKLNTAPNAVVYDFFKNIQDALILAHRKNELVGLLELERDDEFNNSGSEPESDSESELTPVPKSYSMTDLEFETSFKPSSESDMEFEPESNHESESDSKSESDSESGFDVEEPGSLEAFSTMGVSNIKNANTPVTSTTTTDNTNSQNPQNPQKSQKSQKSQEPRGTRYHGQNSIFSSSGNEHFTMKEGDIGLKQTFDVPIVQGSLNPTLKNTISRFVNLDSQFRPYSNNTISSSTNYNITLSDQLTNTLSLRLYSYEIPFTWYVFDHSRGNTCMWVQLADGSAIKISINPGNYSPADFVIEMNRAFADAGIQHTLGNPVECVSYSTNTGKISIDLNADDYMYASGIVSITSLLFHSNTLTCTDELGNNTNYINRSLGWCMGFRETSASLFADGTANVGESVADFFGTKYIIMALDDFNQNRINNGLVTITEPSSGEIKLPEYYSTDMPEYVIPANSEIAESSSTDLIAGKQSTTYTATQQLAPSAPRTLTNAQLYTINEINKNRANNTNLKSRAPTNSDIMAIIPLKRTSFDVGGVITELSGSLQDNPRTYFGPVNIDKMHVKLLDDHGNVLNMNGGEWCTTLIATCLYQY
jgi:hypothetical protein